MQGVSKRVSGGAEKRPIASPPNTRRTKDEIIMTRRIAAALTRALAPASPGNDDMHFHAGSHGPYVCENPRCTSPGLDVSQD